MTLAHSRLTAGTVAIGLNHVESDGSPGQSLLVQNGGTATVYLGGINSYGTVTTSSFGNALAAGGQASFDLAAGEYLYAITAAVDVPVNVVYTGI